MPFYVYETVRRDGKEGTRFEVMQGIHDDPLKKDPKTGKPVRRVLFAPSTPQFRYDKAVKQINREDRLKAEPRQTKKKRKGA